MELYVTHGKCQITCESVPNFGQTGGHGGIPPESPLPQVSQFSKIWDAPITCYPNLVALAKAITML